MADQTNPNADSSRSHNFLPKFFQSDANKKFLQATVDQLTQPGSVKKVNGYIGRQNAKASTGEDIFLAAANSLRQQYQLEPGLVVNDQLGNTTFFKDYQDYLNQLNVFGGNLDNHARLNKQEFYSWDPHIDWDKFVNFQNYYWLPYGPDAITIRGQQEEVISEYNVVVESEGDNNVYVFFPNGLDKNPSLNLYRGQTYKFNIDSIGNPFSIKTIRSSGPLNRYQTVGLDSQAIEQGTITFTVPYDSPDVLYYVSESDANLGGIFTVSSITENSSINVETDLLGKVNYTLPDGTELSNGMKVSFIGNVTPEKYASGFYYVEGVGTSITLIEESILQIVSGYTTSETILFDAVPFDSLPFEDATSLSATRDYIVINRGSVDHNPWSRNNRWFHKDVIDASAKFNGKNPTVDQSTRAVRSIIEFEAGLKLFNFGTRAIADVDLIDTYTTDVFSSIEGQVGYNIDGINLIAGQRVLFTADTDRLVHNNIYRVSFDTIQGVRQLHLTLEDTPSDGDVVLIKQGKLSQGTMQWYGNGAWSKAQQKTTTNQTPYFDVFDSNTISYGDSSQYDGTTFKGTRLFSYKVGTGKVDTNLGFALSYKNISNIGDIVFDFNILSDTFQFKTTTNVIKQPISVGYLQKVSANGTVSYVNGWQTCHADTIQSAIRIYKNSNKVNNFDLDIFDNLSNLSDLTIKVYVNGIRLDKAHWSVTDGPVYKKIVLNADITSADVLTIRAFTKQPCNSNGYYEIPVNLQNNPLNETLSSFTLGEVIDHVGSIVDNLEMFSGLFPGPGNLRDLGNVTQYGTKFVQHSGPMSLSMYHVTVASNNIVRAIESARDEYNKFKRNFIVIAETLGIDTDIKSQVDLILQKINKDKPKTAPYYFSDMVPYGAKISTSIEVVDRRIKTYPLSNTFSLDVLSSKAVIVYLNDTQLLYGRDYSFSDQGFIVINGSVALQNADTITIDEYENTNGTFIPPTPTKLGIWPKFQPAIYTDTSLITPREMIQGHDGSQVLAYGDYRDALILELEQRIYNNIKVQYNPDIFDINDIVPGYIRTTDYSLSEFNQTLAPNFYKWLTLVDKDFSKPLSYDRNNSLSYNYRGHIAPDGRETPGYWKGVYRWMLDTDRPNLCPWEMLGFSEEPTWWTSVYGPAPYTSDNLPMWTDLSNGVVRQPGVPAKTLTQYARPFLLEHIPVDEQGNVVSPLISGLSEGIITSTTSGDFVFGDVSPIESAWRRSSHYPFSVLLTSMILQPSKTFGTLLDRSRIVRNIAGQLVYKDTGLRIRPQDIKLPSIYSSSDNVQTAGIINYIVDYILSDNLKSYSSYAYDLTNITAKLSYRLGAFTSKEKFNLILDSKTPLSQGSVFVPQEDYSIILNTSSPVKKISYSAVIITKLPDGFEIKGYSNSAPYFKYYGWTQTGITINVGGISESYSLWTGGSQYAAGKIVEYNNRYYRSLALHTTTAIFSPSNYQLLSSLPVIGGKTASLRKAWDRTSPITIPYGTKFTSIQEVVDFLQGYGEYLKDEGFVFDNFNTTLGVVTNWESSAKEFLFWTTQNWSTGEDKWSEWLPLNTSTTGDIVRYNGDYYRAVRNSPASNIFIEDNFVKLDGLSTIGSSVLSLSPSATGITFATPLSVVDDISNLFNTYEIFKVDGTPLKPNFLNSFRQDNTVSYSPRSDDGIFGASFYLIQQEQVVILNNTTMFNDTIYNPASGYRQERIKVSGYTSVDWFGGFDIPGFIFDQAKIQAWEAWKDYALGDIVKYKEFYYSAQSFLVGSEVFVPLDWIKLDKTPTQALLPNWSYKAGQFTDFYSLDSDNFDATQQQLAQHLIGYQKRQYLDNIIQDDVSEFKFYQGMITEKGTQNVFNKLFDVLSADNKSSLSFYEEWALRVGQYGASASYENIEFKLDESLFKNNPQGIELVNTVDQSVVDFIIRQTPNDVYLKPLGYANTPWPTIKNYAPYLRTPGYVRSNDVSVTLTSISDILTQDISTFKHGDYIWCGFEGQNWNVYRYTNSKLSVAKVTYSSANKQLTITLNGTSPFAVGDYIGINRVAFSGFYKVSAVSGLSAFVVDATVAGWSDPFTEQNVIELFTITSQRVKSIDDIDSIIPTDVANGELLWTDDNGTGKWSTWTHKDVYEKSEILNSSPQAGLGNGRRIVINPAGTITAISNYLGDVIVYDKVDPTAPWLQRQIIVAPFISFDGLLPPTPDSATGDIIAMSSDGTWLATGTPLASEAVTSLVNGIYVVDPSGTSSGLTNQGAVSLYKKDSNNIYSLIDTFLSPVPTANQQFGSNLVFGNNTLLIGSKNVAGNAGILYQLSYLTTVMATTSYNPEGSDGTTLKVSNTAGITVGMAVTGTGFTNKHVVVSVVDSKTLILNVAPDSTPSGLLSFTSTRWQYTASTLPAPIADGTLSMSKDGNTLLVSWPVYPATTTGRVYVYTNVDGTYTQTQMIQGADAKFGTGLTVSDTADYIAISSVLADLENIDQGSVTIYKLNNGTYEVYQSLANLKPELAEFFGAKIAFMNDYKTIVVYSQNQDSIIPLTFDNSTTSFDDYITQVVTTAVNGGIVDVFDRYGSKWVYSESLVNDFETNAGYGTGFAVGKNTVMIGAPAALDQTFRSGRVYSNTKIGNAFSWEIMHEEIARPDVSKIKQAFLYNTVTNKLVTYLDVLDSNQGKIPGVADQEIKYKTFYDPAVYSIGDSNVNVDDGMAWAADQVGMLWWDLRTAKFLDSSDNDIVYRNGTWNTLFPGASIDVYEWVGSKLLPAAWNAQADTETGLSLGISGNTLYDNTVYSVVKRYDNVSKTFKNTYYYWVKNKTTVPAIASRSLSASDVAKLIENPRGQGYSYLALTGANSFSLVNVANLLQDSNVALSVEYWTVDNTNKNIHTQWKLISTDVDSNIPTAIEQKWIDSLCGKDTAGRLVPDTALPIKLRYGVENRPRQGMFINRFEALKQLIEQVNRVLITNQVADTKLLNSYEGEPSNITGIYDTVLDTDSELRFASVTVYKRPTVTPVIVDGKITSINVIDSGQGYLNAPYIEVSGSGTGAKIRSIINAKGQITGAEIIESGQGYDDATALTIRNYAVLVHSDSNANGNWSIYAYEPTTQVWSRVQSQSYDTRNYWSHADWYATGFNQFTAIDYAVNTLTDLSSQKIDVGQTVKVLTSNNSGWVILLKYADAPSFDWTQSYQVVGAQNGTIQFSSVLYQFADSTYGYDGSLYDGGIFDNVASTELRNILTSIKNDILVDDLKGEYLKLFFSSLRYALTEQNYIDWAFKTSFVKVHHNVGQLKQKVTYNNDNLTDFEAYVTEVKPYRTKVREYISNYSNLDTSSLSITDFDVPSAYDNGKLVAIDTRVVDGKIVASDNMITAYPWKHWLDNVGFTVTSISIVSGGEGYLTAPVVKFVGTSGAGATARAFIANGKVNRIILLTPGAGYLSTPTIVLDGGLSATGTSARAVAIIGNSAVRSSLIKMKFDRITNTYFINQLEHTETFTGTGSRLQFSLLWGPDIRIGSSKVTVNNVAALRDSYTLSITKSTTKGYTSYAGSIMFDVAPAKGAAISVTYIKDWSLLNAADRIQFYYDPATGELGKDLAQLMTGIDYGGVVIDGMDFSVNAGWGELPYYSDKWDSLESTFDDYILTVAADTHEFTLPYTPEAGTEINIYYSHQFTDTPYVSDGVTKEYSYSIFDNTPLTVVATLEKEITQLTTVGADTLKLDSVVGLKINDVVTIPGVTGAVAYNAKIIQIIPTTKIVQFDQIFFADIASGHTAVFTRELFAPDDYVINLTGLVQLYEALAVGTTLTISALLTTVRIDDANFGTPDASPYAVMLPVIADGTSRVVTIPNTFTVYEGDQFILRKSTSDGSVAPIDGDYDSAINGGSLQSLGGVYTTATGKRAEDIIIDGDGFVTPTNSNAPEEVVPGQVVDTLSIKVFDKPSAGAATIKVNNLLADGITDRFDIDNMPNSAQAVIVKLTNGAVSDIQTQGDDYIVDYPNQQILFITPPIAGYTVSIFSIGFNGSNILDLDYFVGDGTTIEFITKARWTTPVSYVVYVNGEAKNVDLFKTDSTYDSVDTIGIRFIVPPAAGALVNYIIVEGDQQTFAITKTERLTGTGATTYRLANVIGDALPNESSMLVRVNQSFLKGPNNSYFTIKSNRLTYTLSNNKFLPYDVSANEIVVLADGKELRQSIDYILDLSGISVKLNKSIYQKYSGKELVISVTQGQGFRYLPETTEIEFTQAYNSSDIIEVISSYKHDVLSIQCTAAKVTSKLVLTPDTPEFYAYKSLASGVIPLDRPVINDNYVWVIYEGELLIPSIDFKLNPDKQSIQLENIPEPDDEYSLITFGSNILQPGIAYMQFKDMLNRVIFKRLSLDKQTKLAVELKSTDTTITVIDASNFDVPSPSRNKPGILEIAGERIEYFTINGNVLGQLRRGTLGTGVRSKYTVGTFVQDIGASETIPYSDSSVTAEFTADGSDIVNLTFVPTKSATDWVYDAGFVSSIPAGYGQADDIEVFAGGVRLKKKPYHVYSATTYPTSPEGDVQFDAEFAVDGTSSQIRLTTPVPFGTRITVVKRQGVSWDSNVNAREDINKISLFLKDKPGVWYTEHKQD